MSRMRTKPFITATLFGCLGCWVLFSQSVAQSRPSVPRRVVVLHAARLLDIGNGKIITPGEVLVEGERIAEAARPRDAEALKSAFSHSLHLRRANGTIVYKRSI